MTVYKRKVLAYITSRGHLLVFRHPAFPEAGIQVPAGTVEADEAPEEAVLREAAEETGLRDLRLVALLGTSERDMADFGREETHLRWFYHLHCEDDVPATWRHWETHPSDAGSAPILFEFSWAPLRQVPVLIADQGGMVPVLLANLTQEGPADDRDERTEADPTAL
jgi:8-oxo-dGTP pyrophosphatase MutT (NUDIX family)